MQQDSQEFLAFLLDGLHEDLNRIIRKPATEKPELADDLVNDPKAIAQLAEECWELHKKRNDSIILDLFAGLYRSTLVCPICGKISITFDPFMDLTLPLPIDNSWVKDLIIVPSSKRIQKATRVKKYSKGISVPGGFPVEVSDESITEGSLETPTAYYSLSNLPGPAILNVELDRLSTVRQLKEYIGHKLSMNPESLIISDVYSGRFYAHYNDHSIVSEKIMPDDITVVYELDTIDQNTDNEFNDEEKLEQDPLSTSPLIIPVFHRTFPENVDAHNFGSSSYGNKITTKPIVGMPVFITLTEEEAYSEELIYKKLLQKYKEMTLSEEFNDYVEDLMEGNEDETAFPSPLFKIQVAQGIGGESPATGRNLLTQTLRELVKSPSISPEKGIFDLKLDRSDRSDPLTDDPVESSTENDFLVDPREAAQAVADSSPSPSAADDAGYSSDTSSGIGALTPDPDLDSSTSAVNLAHSGSFLSAEQSDASMDHKTASAGPAGVERSATSTSSDMEDLVMEENKIDSNKPLKDLEMEFTDDLTGASNPSGIAGNPASPLPGYSSESAAEPSPSLEPSVPTIPSRLVNPDEALVCDWLEPVFSRFFGKDLALWDNLERIADPELDEQRRIKAIRQQQGISLDDCLDLFSKPELLGENDFWYCSRCKELRQATKTIELWRAPDIFTVHLKRFSSFRSFRDKISAVVQFPIEGLDMEKWIGGLKYERLAQEEMDMKDDDLPPSSILKESQIYDLFAVDNHFGGLGGGHYTAYVKNFYDNTWYYYDDSHVKPADPEDAVTGAAYLLFYRRRSSNPLGGDDYANVLTQINKERSKDEHADLQPDSKQSTDTSSPDPFKGTGHVLGGVNSVAPSWATSGFNAGSLGFTFGETRPVVDQEMETEETQSIDEDMTGDKISASTNSDVTLDD